MNSGIGKILKKHLNTILAVLAVVFLAAIILSFVWGIMDISSETTRAGNASANATQAPSFDLKGAAGLDYRGTLQP